MLKRTMTKRLILAVVVVGWNSTAKAQAVVPIATPKAIDYGAGPLLVQATTTAFRIGKESDFEAPEFKGKRAPQADNKLNYSVQTITHVYSGPATLLHQTFNYPDRRDYGPGGFGHVGGYYPYPRQIGTTGIWCLQPKEEIDEPLIPTPGVLTEFPALEGQTPRYSQLKALAQAIEKIGHAKREQQEQLIRKDARSAIPELTTWAINMLAYVEPQAAGRFLHDLLADPKLPLLNQARIDAKLLDLQGKDWQESPQRLRLFQHWVSTKWSHADAAWLIHYLTTIWEDRHLAPTTLFDLLRTAIANPQLPVAAQAKALYSIEMLIIDEQIDEALAFNFCVAQIKEDKAPQMQLAAAHALSRLKVIPPQAAIVQGLLRQITDPQTLKVLQWVADGQKPPPVAPHHAGMITALAFSSDGKTLATGSEDNAVRLWDVITGRQLRALTGHKAEIDVVAFSPDGKTLVSRSVEGTVALWDVATGQQLHVFTDYQEAIDALAFSPDSKILASGSRDEAVKLWDVATGKELRNLMGHIWLVTAAAFSPDGKTLACGVSGRTVQLWDVASGQQLHSFTGYTGMIMAVAFSPDSKTLVSCDNDKTVQLWDVTNGQRLHAFSGHKGELITAALSPDGQRLATLSTNDTVILWDVAKGQPLRVFYMPEINALAFNQDGRTLATGSVNATIKLWDVATGQVLQTLRNPGG